MFANLSTTETFANLSKTETFASWSETEMFANLSKTETFASRSETETRPRCFPICLRPTRLPIGPRSKTRPRRLPICPRPRRLPVGPRPRRERDVCQSAGDEAEANMFANLSKTRPRPRRLPIGPRRGRYLIRSRDLETKTSRLRPHPRFTQSFCNLFCQHTGHTPQTPT